MSDPARSLHLARDPENDEGRPSQSADEGDAGADLDSIIKWYQKKTGSVTEKFGPGPKIHFHVGYFEGPPTPVGRDIESCRRILVASQEALLRRAAEVWDASKTLSGSVLDVGCGLGGGSIFWAEEYGAKVTALTIVKEHATIVEAFAKQAGQASRVQTRIDDACAIKSHLSFDAAVAIESSCYLPRARWFRRLAGLLREGGSVCIEDTFVEDPRFAAPFDDHWKTRIGPLDEYREAAERAGFVLDSRVDITENVADFWRHSATYSELLLDQGRADEAEAAQLKRSICWQSTCLAAWYDRRVTTWLLRFRYRGRSSIGEPQSGERIVEGRGVR